MKAGVNMLLKFKGSYSSAENSKVLRGVFHRIQYFKFKLPRDIEKMPGPNRIDPRKTTDAPYCESKVAVFGS